MKISSYFVLCFIFHHISNLRCLYKILGLKNPCTSLYFILMSISLPIFINKVLCIAYKAVFPHETWCYLLH